MKNLDNKWVVVEVDSKPIRSALYEYFEKHDWPYRDTITKVECFFTKPDKNSKFILEINIETHKPGLLIGKGSDFINGLNEYIKNVHRPHNGRVDFEIHITECTLWHDIY